MQYYHSNKESRTLHVLRHNYDFAPKFLLETILEVSFSVGRHMATVQLSHDVASQLQNKNKNALNFSAYMRSVM